MTLFKRMLHKKARNITTLLGDGLPVGHEGNIVIRKMKTLVKKYLPSVALALFMLTLIGVGSQATAVTLPLHTFAADTCSDPKYPIAIEGTGGNVVCCPPGTGSDDSMGCLFNKYVNPAVDLLSAVAGVAVVVAIIMGAIQYSGSAGDANKTAKAKERIRNAVIALIAFAFLYAFLKWILPGGI